MVKKTKTAAADSPKHSNANPNANSDRGPSNLLSLHSSTRSAHRPSSADVSSGRSSARCGAADGTGGYLSHSQTPELTDLRVSHVAVGNPLMIDPHSLAASRAASRAEGLRGASPTSNVFAAHSAIASKNRLGEVVKGALYIGPYRLVANERILRRHGIRAFLCVANIAQPLPPCVTADDLSSGAVSFKQVSLADGPSTRLAEHVAEVFKFIDEQTADGRPVALYCQQGKSRSASFAVAYLMREYDWNYSDALRYLKQVYPAADPNIDFLYQLQNIRDQLPTPRSPFPPLAPTIDRTPRPATSSSLQSHSGHRDFDSAGPLSPLGGAAADANDQDRAGTSPRRARAHRRSGGRGANSGLSFASRFTNVANIDRTASPSTTHFRGMIGASQSMNALAHLPSANASLAPPELFGGDGGIAEMLLRGNRACALYNTAMATVATSGPAFSGVSPNLGAGGMVLTPLAAAARATLLTLPARMASPSLMEPSNVSLDGSDAITPQSTTASSGHLKSGSANNGTFAELGSSTGALNAPPSLTHRHLVASGRGGGESGTFACSPHSVCSPRDAVEEHEMLDPEPVPTRVPTPSYLRRSLPVRSQNSSSGNLDLSPPQSGRGPMLPAPVSLDSTSRSAQGGAPTTKRKTARGGPRTSRTSIAGFDEPIAITSDDADDPEIYERASGLTPVGVYTGTG
jgi:predicted protein tyrosine phosphatase